MIDFVTLTHHHLMFELLQCSLPVTTLSYQINLTKLFILFNSTLDISGYIASVSPPKLSSHNNRYFDVQLQTEDLSLIKIRVMENNATKRGLFMEKFEGKSSLKLTNLSDSNGNMSFFNGNAGSTMLNVERLPSHYEPPVPLLVTDILNTPVQGSFATEGKLV